MPSLTRIARVFAGMLAVWALADRPASACSCITGIPLCDIFWKTTAVFSATVLDIDPDPGKPLTEFTPDRVVRLQVEQTWRGGLSGIVNVRTSPGGAGCGYNFVRGVKYLVYAHRNGALLVTSCGRTRPLAEAQEDLEYFKTAFQPAATGRVFGTVKYYRQSDTDPERPVAGRAVVVQLEPDRYVVGVNVRRRPDAAQPYSKFFYPGVTEVSAARVIDLERGERIELEPFVLPEPLGERRFSGIVRWADGTPAAGVDVVLNPPPGMRNLGSPSGTFAKTGKDGSFTVVGLAGGRYYLNAYVTVKQADGSTQWSARSPEFDGDADNGAFTLTLAPPPRR